MSRKSRHTLGGQLSTAPSLPKQTWRMLFTPGLILVLTTHLTWLCRRNLCRSIRIWYVNISWMCLMRFWRILVWLVGMEFGKKIEIWCLIYQYLYFYFVYLSSLIWIYKHQTPSYWFRLDYIRFNYYEDGKFEIMLPQCLQFTSTRWLSSITQI